MAKVTFLTDVCKGCGLCVGACPKGIIALDEEKLNAKVAVDNLNKVSEELASVEFDDLFEEVGSLVESSQKSIDNTMKEIDKISF